MVVVLAVFALSVITRTGDQTSAVPAGNIAALLDQVQIVDERPNQPGYDRDCSRGRACVFGPAWQEFKGLPGRNGCDQRNDVLRVQMRKDTVTVKPGTNGCVVLSGTLDDPYSGREIRFRRTAPLTVQIDHVYPLAAAWDMGANRWTLAQRRQFANDTARNLLAVDGDENHDKSDQTPAEWLVPHNPVYRCTYVAKYLRVAVDWRLPITKADAAAIRKVARNC
jgi:hypothetical protein